MIVAVAAAACGRLGFDDRGGELPVDAAADAAHDAATLPNRIVHFAFDDTPTQPVDDTGGYQGSCTNNTCPTSVSGRIGNGFQFDGVDDCFEISPTIQPVQALTIALWARQDDTGPMTFVSQPYFVDAPNGNSWEVEAGFNLDFTLTILHGATYVENGTISGQVAVGAWYHVAFSWDGTRQRIYVGGSQIAQMVAPTTPIPYDGSPWYIGCDDNMGTVQPMRGALDDVSLFDRALSSAEIAVLANP